MTDPTEAEIEAATQAIRTEAEKSGGDLYGRCARAALTAAAQVRGRAPATDLVDRLRGRGRKRTVSFPDILHEAADEIERLTAEVTKSRLMPIYGATEDRAEKTARHAQFVEEHLYEHGVGSSDELGKCFPTIEDQGEDVLGYRPPDGE